MKHLYTCANRATFPVLEKQSTRHRDELGKGGFNIPTPKLYFTIGKSRFPTSNIITDISVERLDNKYFICSSLLEYNFNRAKSNLNRLRHFRTKISTDSIQETRSQLRGFPSFLMRSNTQHHVTFYQHVVVKGITSYAPKATPFAVVPLCQYNNGCPFSLRFISRKFRGLELLKLMTAHETCF